MNEKLAGALEGAAGGVAGTVYMSLMVPISAKLPVRLRPPMPNADPTEKIADALHVFDPRARKLMSVGSRWAYGTFWGAALGVVGKLFRARTFGRLVGLGAAMGAVVWAVGYVGWMPALRMISPIHRQGAVHTGVALANHVVYGALAAIPIWGMERLS